MLYQSFLEILKEYQVIAPTAEYTVIDELSSYVAEREDCFERIPEENARHIAASVLLLTPDLERALFLWHSKIRCWTQPGGHADGNPDIHAVALQELKEETGVVGAKLVSSNPLNIYRYDYPSEVFGYRKSIYNLCFMAVLPESQEPKILEPEKCEAMRWATPEEALELIRGANDESTERLVYKWQKFQKLVKGGIDSSNPN
jgi:8-oxo-dGTP pyrophosphatase MutT (NUDIX family)